MSEPPTFIYILQPVRPEMPSEPTLAVISGVMTAELRPFCVIFMRD